MNDRALLLIGESYNNADMYHAIRFLFSDPVIYLRHQEGDLLVCSNFERAEAAQHSRVREVLAFDQFEYPRLLRELPKRYQAFAELVRRVVARYGVMALTVTGQAPVHVVDHLRAHGVDVICDPEAVLGERLVKQDDALAALQTVQRANERAMWTAIEMIADSVPRHGVLVLGDEPLTAERLHAAIDASFLAMGCLAEGTITAGGPAGASPHNTGAGPFAPNQTIVLDIFPRHKQLRYYADMTRTVSKGDPGPELCHMYDTVLRAQEVALSMIAPGVNGRTVYAAVCRHFEDAGYATSLRTGSYPERGFIHSLGHGLGLEIHEAPHLGDRDEILDVGHVVTVEPGLYDPRIGGVRIEDVVVVTPHGCSNLTQFEKRLVV
ncbi:MAG TPA: M24 family metallopeptidase [Chloroflexota bacterium]|nr:M24 family metallopeptidase [Chloroflexota bacterium]